MEVFSTTDVGLLRENNEDRMLVFRYGPDSCLLAVADGMGGEEGGEVAAQLAVDTLTLFDPTNPDVADELLQLFDSAHAVISKMAREKPRLEKMATTLTVAFVTGNRVVCAYVGDSRVQVFSHGRFRVETLDHSVCGLLIKKGEITWEDARTHPMSHVITRCLGCKSHTVDTKTFTVEKGDIVLLSTDGLHDAVSHETMIMHLDADCSLERKIYLLVAEAISAGGRDNITVVGALV